MKNISVKNTKSGWIEAWKETRTQIFNKSEIISYRVVIPMDNTSEEIDETNFKFFMPIMLELKESRWEMSIIFNGSSNKIYWRVVQFLRLIFVNLDIKYNHTSSYYSIKIKNYDLENEKKTISENFYASDIFPLLAIGDNYLDLKYLTSEIDFNKDIVCENELSKLIKVNFDYVRNEEKYVGSDNKKLEKEDKKRLSADLQNLIKSKKMTALTSAIFLFILRNLIERKTIFTSDYKAINLIVFRKVFSDAESYSEGIYQLIENSCIHSYGKTAFFGIRIFNTDRNFPMSRILDATEKRVRLNEKYSICFGKNRNNIFNSTKYTDFIEFFVIDSALNGMGIVPSFNKAHKESEGPFINFIKEIFNLEPNSSDDYIIHYGLRWFDKIIRKNDGVYYIVSPNSNNDKNLTLLLASNEYENLRRFENFSTDYNILLPINYAWRSECQLGKQDFPLRLFCDEVVAGDFYIIEDDFDNFNFYGKFSDKKSKIKILHDSILENFKKNFAEVNNAIYRLNLLNTSYTDVEIVAKTLFWVIYDSKNKKIKFPKYIALDFCNHRDYINEFIRIFSIFYDRSGTNEVMDCFQIALCSNSLINDSIKEVNFIISGKNEVSAYKTANAFLYYNSESTMEFIPLLEYLKIENSKKDNVDEQQKVSVDESLDIFPFDLFLSEDKKEQSDIHGVDPWLNSWFINRLKEILNTDIRKKNYGCKISNVHIRLSSRIHISDFYEAELLFHNIGNVYRFAYLLSREIVKNYSSRHLDCSEDNTILIYGYEEQTSILVQKVVEILDSTFEAKVPIYSAIYCIKNESESKIEYYSSVKGKSVGNKINEVNKVNVVCYIVVPVSTTMTTVYKLLDKLNSECASTKKKFEVGECYSIVAVTDDIEKSEVVKDYYDNINYEQKEIKLIKQTNGIETDNKVKYQNNKVKYLFNVKTKWYNATTCALCYAGRRPLIQVDKTSTLPETIFELYGSNRKFFNNKVTENLLELDDNNKSSKRDNEKRLALFKPEAPIIKADKKDDEEITDYKPKLIYSHIVRGVNHYQFYFDFALFIEKNKEDIIDWAGQLQIESNAFNIVLSPLSITNSLFLKIVIDNVFSSCLRFMHINIDETYKENARARFSYIAEEYKYIKSINNDVKFNIYYVDDSIVTGQTLYRGRTFLKMLLDESGIFYNDVKIFKKVFLLVNRCSYDTANNFVDDPYKNMQAYLQLAIPPYNTKADHCPACSVRDNYMLLHKRAASVELANMFKKAATKHDKRDIKEYQIWFNERILTSHSYFARIKLWLYHAEGITEKSYLKIKSSISKYENNKIHELLDDGDIIVKKDEQDDFAKRIHELTLKDYLEHSNEKYKKEIINLVKYLEEERAYIRLKTMNTAYEELGPLANSFNKVDFSSIDMEEKGKLPTYIIDTIAKIKDVIEKILKESLNSNEINPKSRKDYYILAETLISVIKVISREQISRYYHIRWAVMEILSDILELFYKDKSVNDGFDFMRWVFFDKNKGSQRTIDNNLCAELQYEIFYTVIHRLAMMQASSLFSKDKREKAYNCYNDLVNKYFMCDKYSLEPCNDIHDEDIKNYKKNVLYFSELPDKNRVAENFVYSVKTATMLTLDDASCYRLLEKVTGVSNE